VNKNTENGLLLLFGSFLFSFGLVLYLGYEYRMLRSNAMDICAWNARQLTAAEKGEPIDGRESTAVYQRVIRGRQTCPFCGQLHDERWVSRNAWDSLTNAFDPTGEKRRQFSR
jgi:hypothetical protein